MGCAPTRIWRLNETKECDMCPHTRVPQTVCRDIWQLAIETSSIPSLHIIRSRIRNQIENRKEPNEPIRKSNRLTKKKIPRTLCHTEFLLGLIDVVQSCVSNEPFYEKNVAVEIPFAVRYFRPSRSALRKLCTNINQPYLIWAAVICRHVPPPKDQWYWHPQSNTETKGEDMYIPWRCCWWLGVAPKMNSGRPIKVKNI